MNNQDINNLEDTKLVPLDQNELLECSGGILPLLGEVFAGLALGLSAS
ncbi:MAG: hypothetical protein HOO91_01980 [Bacteroidales bacterium]|nr:hypothetical protein [Bacteroidales bacterium]